MTCWDLCLLLTGLWTAGTCHAFKAAVYEHALLGDPANEPFEVLVAKNLDSYGQAVQAAAAEGCDIIVFPEKGLMLGLDDRQKLSLHAEDIPDAGALPCLEGGDLTPVLAALSCLARDNRIYVVANVYDHKHCPPGRTSCPPDGVLFYNTNVALDRNGTLVSRYHKNHLFREALLDTPEPFEEAVFETDFGARVGMFICFDVLFPEAAQLVARHNITLAVMSTLWHDVLPGIYSVAVQQAWSLAHGVPLLAAGVQRPPTGTLGSGIYAGGRGPLIYSYSPDNRSKLLIANTDAAAPENSRYAGDVLDVRSLTFSYMNTSAFAVASLLNASGEMLVCNGEVCCRLSYASTELSDAFFLIAGWTKTSRVCSLTVCDKRSEGRPCTKMATRSSTRFSSLRLEARFATPYVYPVLASDGLALTSVRSWSFKTSPGHSSSLSIDERNPPKEPILHAFIAAIDEGREISKEDPSETKTGREHNGCGYEIGVVFFFVLLVVSFVLYHYCKQNILEAKGKRK